jgi:biopolymer transport protein ExbD
LRESTPKDVVISVDAQGGTFWSDACIAGRDDLQQRLKKIAA